MGIEAKPGSPSLDDVVGDVLAMQQRMRDLSPATKVAAIEFNAMIVRDVFGKEQSPFGEKWKPLSKATQSSRRKGKGNASTSAGTHKVLQDTTALKSGHNAVGKPSSLEFGVSGQAANYAAAHQFGKKKSNRGYYQRSPFKRSSHTRMVNGKSQTVKRHNVRGHAVKGKPFGGAAVPARPHLPVDQNGEPSFHAGPAKEWAEKLERRVTNWVLDGTKSSKPRG